jgi:translation initiation factor IF-3
MANPPVCKILNYSKYLYELKQRDKEARKKATNVVIKEMKYRPKIGGGDFDTKTRKVAEFLDEGHKVKITIMFRGREVAHPELGMKILNRIAEIIGPHAKMEATPRLDGRNMTMVLAPEKKVVPKVKESRGEGSSASVDVVQDSTPEVTNEPTEHESGVAPAPEPTLESVSVPESAPESAPAETPASN